MSALARWGMPLLGEPDDDTVVRPWTAVNVAVAIYYDPVAAEGVDERYELRVDGDVVTLSSVKGGGLPREPADVVFESDARAWLDIRRGLLTLAGARARGTGEGDGQGEGRRQLPAHLPRELVGARSGALAAHRRLRWSMLGYATTVTSWGYVR